MCVHIDTHLHSFFQNINSEFCSIENTVLEQKHFSSSQTTMTQTLVPSMVPAVISAMEKGKKKINKLVFKAEDEKHTANESQAMFWTKKLKT